MQIDEFHDIGDSERLRRFLNEGAPEGSASNKVCVFQDGSRWQFEDMVRTRNYVPFRTKPSRPAASGRPGE